jgi:hypothetical protein
MIFESWWKLLKPAECDEVKPQFEDCWQQAYAAGREAMRQECVKVCEEFDIPDRVEGAHPDYITGKRMAAVQVSHKIKGLK